MSLEWIGALAAAITSFCWLPQILQLARTRQTAGISLASNAFFASGVALWLIYGLAIGSMPVIGANAVTLVFVLVIVGFKLRYH
ncbi:SemiSWEET family sugar transporter [Aurantimonas sp. VKM B-3413]|uniref:SemiSWEET family sugar transporter n=1 Tax=Aurantimonas sp. VKM B-3413 TaxID=2779401 RepID=UPI001E572626|nr:SemiSWEET transporter [Aurantimonas sp. VKM B-3413]MCB8836505.1 SemiSWEET transporter [Aurantimonas sp. VKM B-3413]